MILQALVSYYEALAQKGEIARPGWGSVKVSFALELDGDGTLVRVLPLSSQSADGKKSVPRTMELPAPVKRSSGISPNFLWDGAAYLLGIDSKGKPERAKDCFDAAKDLHLSLLAQSDDPFSKAVCGFFSRWRPDEAARSPLLAEYLDDILKGANLVFLYAGEFPGENTELRRVWQTYYDGDADGDKMRCLVTGEETVPEKVHPAIKNVMGAQSSGAALVSFNADAFCSYGREQNLNAPVGKYAAFAYTTALNTLLADRDHVRHFGDTTVVFWAEGAEPAYQTVFAGLLDGGGDKLTNEELKGCMDDLAHGRQSRWQDVPLHPENRFYILGLSPNAARLSVRFFLQGSFGDFASNVEKHYQDISVSSSSQFNQDINSLQRLVFETIKYDKTKFPDENMKKVMPQMAGDVLRAILSGQAYPATLYQQTQLRIRAEHDVTRGRAGIIKACLTRMKNNEKYREALTVELNEQTRYQPYVLGRLFSVLEGLQQAANPDIKATIKDKYFTSAGATPAVVFPTLLNLGEKHLRKLDGGKRVYWAKQITALTGLITETYPAHHSLYEQGVFQLGYYHQTEAL